MWKEEDLSMLEFCLFKLALISIDYFKVGFKWFASVYYLLNILDYFIFAGDGESLIVWITILFSLLLIILELLLLEALMLDWGLIWILFYFYCCPEKEELVFKDFYWIGMEFY